MGSHYRTVLAPGSPFVGQNCPISRQTLQVGQEVVVCADSQTAFQMESWEYLGEQCQICQASEIGPPPETWIIEERPSASAAWLVAPNRLSFPLDRDVVDLGRSPDNHLILDDVYASEHHARIRRTGRVFYLFDLASTNGTWVNDQRIHRLLLADGDRIRVGNTVLVFKQVTEDGLPGPAGVSDTDTLILPKDRHV